MAELSLRSAKRNDCKLLWRWANDPEVRRNAYDSEAIPWKDHIEWFERKMSSSSSAIYIAEVGSEPIGQIRFDIDGSVAVVDASVAKAKRGKGYGTTLIRRGTQRFLERSKVERVDAYVKTENVASRNAFKKAGYFLKDKVEKKGEMSCRFSFS